MTTKAKVYEGVVCLEINSADGAKWWYQGTALAYSPALVQDIKVLRVATIQGTRKPVLAAPISVGNSEHLVVLNLPRSDVVALKRRGLIPRDMPLPHEKTDSTDWPEYTNNKPSSIRM
jgi:hypothetical protein